jgi:Capsule assembly protein Wzi
MAKLKWASPWLLLALQTAAYGRGVSPYLPLNLEPEIESQIERVLILGNKSVLTRPIAAATVLDALPKACKVDPILCARVRRYLGRFSHNSGITHASVEGAVSSGAGTQTIDPNRYGMREDSHWVASGQVYLQPSDYLLVDAGAVAYEGKTDFTGSMVSFGFDKLQLDLGFRPHWFSPMTDSSMLMSTEAPTMPSVTLSNYQPMTRLQLHYELFAAVMSKSNRIVFGDGYTQGRPRLAGFHLDMEPAEGWSLGINRLVQYGGGALGGNSIKNLVDAFFNPSAAQSSTAGHPQPFGNQQASITGNILFPGRVPFSVYFEYAGEDTSRGKNYLLGNSALSVGIHFPRLWQHFDLTLEASEWQNLWYVHNVYLDGMSNYGRVTGNWGADQRVFGDEVGARSQMISIGYEPPFGGLLQLRYRALQNQTYSIHQYEHFHDVSLGYSRPWASTIVGGELESGKDVFGANFTRLAGFIRYDDSRGSLGSSVLEALSGDEESSLIKDGELFVDSGANINRQNIDLTTAATRSNGPVGYGYHVALGARRFVSRHSDLGTRLEIDQIQGHNLLGVRLLDYRYRFHGPVALTVFLGANRYNLATPAYGLYYGGGLQWRNILQGWDVGFDYRYADSVARDHLLPSDPPNIGARTDSFYNISSFTVSISRHF